MRKRILQVIEESWNLPVFEHHKMSEVFKRILTVYNMLEVFELGEGSTVALYGRNSFNWIAIYIACLLKGVRLLIIHPNASKLEIAHITLLTNTNHIFIDDDLVSDGLWKNILLKSLISINTLLVLFERTQKTYYSPLAAILVDSEDGLYVDLKTMRTLFEEDEIESSVITGTSGTEYGWPKWVESSTSSIEALLKKAIAVVPFNIRDKVYSSVEFAESHYLTVLLPFVKMCIFVGNKEDAEVVIEDTNSIEDIWRRNVSQLYGNRFLSFVFTIPWMRWTFKRVAIHRMKKVYGKKLEKLIIYNNTVNEEVMSILVDKMPIYSTYGSQETNQLVAINNYSTKEKRLPGAVGTALPGLVFNTFENQLEISGSSLFDNYVADKEYTRQVRYRDVYETGDVGYTVVNSDVLFVYGRSSATTYNDYNLPIQLDKIERIIRSIPYIKEVILYPILQDDRQKLIMLVYPDVNFVEAKSLGLLRLNELMKVYLKRINLNLRESVYIDFLRVLDEPLKKTQDGKICRYYYTPKI